MEITPDILFQYLENPDKLGISSHQQISDLVGRFPFFQTARLLQIKNMQQVQKNIDPKILNLTAAYVTDRRVLYYLLYGFGSVSGVEAKQEADEGKPAVEKEYKESLKENIADTLSKQLNYVHPEPEHEIELIPGLAIDIRKEYGEGIELDEFAFGLGKGNQLATDALFELGDNTEKEQEQTDHITEETPGAAETELNSVHFSSDQDAGALEFMLEDGVAPGTDIPSGNTRNEKEGAPDMYSFHRVEEAESLPGESKPDEGTAIEGVKLFNEWLDAINGSDVATNTNVTNDYAERSALSEESTMREEAQSGEVIAATSSDLTESSEKQDLNDSLIENFLRSNPRIVPSQTTGENEDISAESVIEHESFFTDTLARIYLKQGNYAKAILAYEKLSLKYPEKSTYFAGQISEIKKRINKL